MPTINKETVKMNDIVYDVVNGRGKVIALTDATIEVRFDNGRRITFSPEGYLNGVRRLFWHNPLVLDPPKNLNEWEYARKVILTTYLLLTDRAEV